MRKTKKVDIQISENTKRTFVVKELIVGEILEVLEDLAGQEGEVGLRDMVEKLLPLASNVKVKDLLKLPPSDIEILVEAFREVNSAFFRGWKAAKGAGLLGAFQSTILSAISGAALSTSSAPATDSPGATAGASSSIQ